ncbi:Calcineurin-like phosphoesterase [Flaviramulus basaltis]|uniref:Calcineurin-like phosphoesterase n=1 Tax=Flaviramulus basaltis TaxID=369401 RepID=A0A1K2IAX3_9FLAO|nr:metallophosphoesterase [Flaviramulus basaltis]SFZ89390.1 Calcineurin-like phosphoesterase [Flaviramulus basaltis]
MKFINYTLSLIIFLTISACATYNPQYASEEDKQNQFPSKEIDKTFYLVGDAGLSPTNGMSLALTAFNKHIEGKKTKEDYTLFLGDNIYPAGLQNKNHKDRASGENALNAQAKSVNDFKGKTIFIPGNHDWYANGLKGLKREEKYVEDLLGKNTFLPEDGCPLKSIDVSETIQLIIIDTQWYLENWNNHPTVNDDCEIKTRERFFQELEGELKKAQNKTTVLAMHHPMFTNGSHGGKYALSKHLYPFQQKIPLPGIASFITQLRTQGGVSIQDRYNERYHELMSRLETMTLDADNVVFVSGHEHTLQYIESESIKQIVSGSGAKESAVELSDTGLFSYGKQGFVELTIFKDGSSWVKYFGEDNGEPKLLFQKEVFPPTEKYDLSHLPDTFPQEVEVSIYSKEETDKTGFFESVWGDHYRNVYSTKIKAKVATLDTLYGGLEVVRKGGGHQTRSLRLKTKDGRELNMRALRKSATQYLQTVLFKDTYIQDEFEKTAIEGLILDFYTAAHPYAFTVVPDLSNAAKIFHTNPKLYFIPKQKSLGEFNREYGGELYMIEERPEDNYADERNFGYADDIESTHDIIEKVREDEKYKIAEDAFVRARLFDMLIGDWDRHQDQWRWAQFDQANGDKYYHPIPRDRDQVFSNFDGALLDVMKIISGSTKQLQVYDDKLEDVEWMNSAGIKIDRVLIQDSNKEVWLEQAKFLQENITDEVIEKAFAKVPEEVQDITLDEIKEKLKGRRSNLQDIATRYYNYLNKLVILTGTDKDDFIEVIRTGDEETRIIISRIKDGEKEEVIVDKIFNRAITKEIWIYGLDDKDVFEVSGKANNLIFTRLIGGQENDIYRIKNGRRIKVYDHKSKPNTIEENKGADIKFSDTYNLNLFDFNKNIVKTSVITPAIGYNPDDGFLLGIQYVKTKKGFQRNPFSTQHRFRGGYYFATNGFSLDYNGEFANIFGDWNLHVGGKFTSENFTNNFFGYGNETVNNDDALDLDFNRVKTGIYAVKVGILKKGNFGSDYGFRTLFEGIEIEDTPDRFVADFMPSNNTDFYKRRFFGGLEAQFNYKSFDNAINPSKGMTFMINIGGKTEFKDTENTYGYLNSDLGFYNSLSKNKKLVLKTDVRTQVRVGDELVFYQAANIGGKNGLRGFRTERFTGKNSFVGSADLRYSFPSFKTNILPFQIGVFSGFDVGRVWLNGDFSDKWHNDYGGGFWVTAAESLSGTFNFFNSEEGLRFSFGFGLNF